MTDTALSYDDILLYPHKGIVSSRSEVDISIALGPWTLPTPFISSPMETVTEYEMAYALHKMSGLGVLHRFGAFGKSRSWMESLAAANLRPIATAIGYGDYERLYVDDVNIFVLDVAHAYSTKILGWVSTIKKTRPDAYLIAGSIATATAALELIDAGADALRVGIGAGAACTTRSVTGFGVPMVTSIVETSNVARKYGVPVIADGGIKNSGDVVKALAVGATAVMIGRLFAGCDEAPLGKQYYGQASANAGSQYVEGSHGTVQDVGSVAGVIEQLSQGLRSGISYGGGTNIKEMQDIAMYNIVTPMTQAESGTRI